MGEPYQELHPEMQARAVAALRQWAASQEDPTRPVLQFLDGTDLRPRDLLEELPPLDVETPADIAFDVEPPSDARGGFRPTLDKLARGPVRRTIRRAQGRKPNRAWTHMLNLVAVSDIHSDESVERLLAEIAGDADAEGGPEAVA